MSTQYKFTSRASWLGLIPAPFYLDSVRKLREKYDNIEYQIVTWKFGYTEDNVILDLGEMQPETREKFLDFMRTEGFEIKQLNRTSL